MAAILVCFLPQYGGQMPGMPGQGMPPHGMSGGPMGGPMPGPMGGPMGGAPPQGGYAPYGGGFPGSYGAPPPAANDPMWGYFTAIAGQVSVGFCSRIPNRRLLAVAYPLTVG